MRLIEATLEQTNKQNYLNSSSPDANCTESPPPRTEIARIQFYRGIHEKWHSFPAAKV